MPRTARIVVPGASHHVTQRGNDRQDIFLNDADRLTYLQLIEKHAGVFRLQVEGYCLMTNHVHLVVIPETEVALVKAIGHCHFLYTKYFNQRHQRTGHLWQNRFYSCPCDDSHALTALAYVELNPVRAGMTQKPWLYPWSSAARHCLNRGHERYDSLCAWREPTLPTAWRETLRAFHREDEGLAMIREHTRTGRPFGGEDFCRTWGKMRHR